MTLTYKWVLHFLWILPVAGFVIIVQNRMRLQALERFADKNLLSRLTADDHKGKRFIKAFLILFALGLLILSMAGPRWGIHYQEVSRKGVDIMMVLDVSRSMAVEDVKPNRLERARREIIDFLKVVQGDRVGLAVFAGAAFVQCPLTLDYAALEMFLSALQPGAIPAMGTDMGAAIETGLSAFDFKVETDKVIMLITDGEDNENRGLEAARKAAGQGIKIFIFGIGEPSGGPVPDMRNKGGFKKDKDGKLVLSKLNETTLQKIASATDGGYVRSAAGDLDLDLLYFEGIKQKTEDQILKSGKSRVHEERFNVFVLLAFLMLLLEGFLDDKQRPNVKKRFGFMIGLAVCVIAVLSMTSLVLAAEFSPDEYYRKGRYEEAEQSYARRDMDHPKDIRYRYNRGCAAFQNGKYKEAYAAFSSVLRRNQDPEVRFKAAYNLGNTAFKQGDVESAIGYYKQALANDPTSQDARYNLEMSLRALEKKKHNTSESQTVDEKDEGGSNKNSREAANGKQLSKSKSKEKNDKGKERRKGQGEGGETQKQQSQNGKQREEKEEKSGKGESPKGSIHKMKKAADNNRDQESTRGKKLETSDNDILKGELKARQALTEMNKMKDTPGIDQPGTDKKMAEALLDNIKENPSKILRFMFPEGNLGRGGSGKEW